VELVAGEGGDGGSLGGSSPRSSRGGRAEKRGKDKDKKERKKKSVHKKRERRAACGPQPVCKWCALPSAPRHLVQPAVPIFWIRLFARVMP